MNDRLYNLLPALYRRRDAAQGHPLQALLAVMEEELIAIEADIDRLYENWFIETCDEWVVPYIADLLGVRGLDDENQVAVSQRSRVANTLRHRRRKGTLATLELVVRDATGWHVRAVEFFKLLAITQSTRHVRLSQGRTMDLRDVSSLDALGGPFETAAHMADMRRKYGVPRIGLFVSRCQSYQVTRSSAFRIKKGCFTFHPLGFDTPLYNAPRTKTGASRALRGRHFAFPICMEDFAKDLREYQHAQEENRPSESEYYGFDRSVSIFTPGGFVRPEKVVCQDLLDWGAPPRGQVAVDVGRGRLRFADEEAPDSVEVSFNYGFSGETGGGPYNRRLTLAEPVKAVWRKTVSGQGDPKELTVDFGSLKAMVSDWNIQKNPDAVVTIVDNCTYAEDLSLDLPAGCHFVIQARDGFRPVLHGNICVQGKGALTLNGLLVKGELSANKSVEVLNLLHCTLVPNPDKSPSVFIDLQNDRLQFMIDRCIIGPLRLPADMSRLTIRDSIIDSTLGMQRVDARAANPQAIEGQDAQAGPATTIERATVFGTVHVRELSLASDVIFTAPVIVSNRQTGGVRHSFVPPGSRTPRRFRCQPGHETSTQQDRGAKVRDDIDKALAPIFASMEYGQPAYAQLDSACPKQIAAGASGESEMGAFFYLRQPQREANLHLVLEDFLPLGLEADIIYM